MTQISNPRSRIGEIGIGIKQFAGSTPDMHRPFQMDRCWTDNPLRPVQLRTGEAKSENDQRDNGIANDTEATPCQRIIKISEDGNFFPK